MGDFLSLITKVFTEEVTASVKEIIHPLEWYEDEESLKLYKQVGSKTYKAVFPKQEGTIVQFEEESLDIEQFKTRFLFQKKALQLLEDLEESAEEQEETIEEEPVKQEE